MSNSTPDPDEPVWVCLCGSTRFWAELAEANCRETAAGRIVLAPGCNMKTEHPLWATKAQAAELKPRLDTLHRHKIDSAHQVLVVNPGGYIGDSTRAEIEYAQSLGKPVRYTEEWRRTVRLTRPGHPDLRLGPYEFRHEADAIAAGLRSQLHCTAHVPGTQIEVTVYDPTLDHHAPYESTDPYALAEQMDQDGDDGTGISFPDTYSRLWAQCGHTEATRVWTRACNAYEWLQSPEEEDEDEDAAAAAQ